ncbi:hypothetical protein AN218_20555 [Streptomyces nanshensis]|uniref:Uncharacterized protein n=2 Tax=Streptomyces nanshensis TaxID=518642 RepID=A0A1E7L0X4_9ACTN|nr:hypothetical protein AN218_20555 [Streptomyces nanshensis]
MFFLGAIYLSAYYGYFRVDIFSAGFGFAEIAMQSLNVVTAPAALVAVVAVLVARQLAVYLDPVARTDGRDGSRALHRLERAVRAVARAHLYVVGAGLLLLVLWPWLGGFRWAAPLLLAAGVLLGQSRWSGGPGTAPEPGPSASASHRTWSRAVPVFTAGLLVMWGLSLAVGALGEREARQAADNLVRRPAVVLLSTERLSLVGPPQVKAEDLGPGTHFRYRYSGLRRLVERNGRYYLLPLGWDHRTGPTYVIRESGDLRVELFPGTRQECGVRCTTR